jgi:hypothetical protein
VVRGAAKTVGDSGRGRGCRAKPNASDPPGRAPRLTERRVATSRWARRGDPESVLAHPTDRMLGWSMGQKPKVRKQGCGCPSGATRTATFETCASRTGDGADAGRGGLVWRHTGQPTPAEALSSALMGCSWPWWRHRGQWTRQLAEAGTILDRAKRIRRGSGRDGETLRPLSERLPPRGRVGAPRQPTSPTEVPRPAFQGSFTCGDAGGSSRRDDRFQAGTHGAYGGTWR